MSCHHHVDFVRIWIIWIFDLQNRHQAYQMLVKSCCNSGFTCCFNHRVGVQAISQPAVSFGCRPCWTSSCRCLPPRHHQRRWQYFKGWSAPHRPHRIPRRKGRSHQGRMLRCRLGCFSVCLVPVVMVATSILIIVHIRSTKSSVYSALPNARKECSRFKQCKV